MYLIPVTVAGLSGIWHGPSRKGWWLKRDEVTKMPLHWQMIRATNTWWLFVQRQYTNCSDITGIFIFVWQIVLRQITACPSVLLSIYLSLCHSSVYLSVCLSVCLSVYLMKNSILSLMHTFSQIIHSISVLVQNIYTGNQILLLFVAQAWIKTWGWFSKAE